MSAGGSDLDKYDQPLPSSHLYETTVLIVMVGLYNNSVRVALFQRTKSESYVTKHASCSLRRAMWSGSMPQ
jgi:hypothetical protein